MDLDQLLGRHAPPALIAQIDGKPEALARALGSGGPAADLVAAAVVARLAERGAPGGLFAVMDAWLAAHGHRVPRRQGHADATARVAGVHLGETLRAALTALLAAGPLRLDARAEFLLVYLWRQIFLNPYSALNLFGPAPPPVPAGAGLLATSLYRPFDAPDLDEAEALWSGPAGLAEKTALALWLVSLPEIGLGAALRDRCLTNAIRLCRGALRAPPPGLVFTILVDEVMAGLFRACYAGGDTCAALSALGDLVAARMPALLPLPPPPAPPPRSRPRIGYVSSAFRSHSVSSYMGNRILCADRRRFEVVTFAIGQRRDALTQRLAAASDELVELDDAEDLPGIARAIRARALDLLVFADIGMDVTTLLLGGLRLAPRQIALMGHATTTGLPTLSHYLGGDHEGPAAERHYRERLVRLPNLGAAQLAPPAAPPAEWRRDLRIPADAVVYVNLNNALKLLPERDDVYAEILARVPAAHLVLKPFFEPASVDERLVRRLVAAAARRGVEARLHVVGPLRNRGAVAGLLAAADVHLDTFPFGGWTSTLDALHAGLPLVTQEGETGRSRWGAGFLRRLGIAEGIARDPDDYVAWAVRLGADAALRARLRERVQARAPGLFFDGPAAQPAYEEALLAVLGTPTGL